MHLRIVFFFSALLIILINGLVHGLWTDRWQGLTEKQIEEAQNRLNAIPLKLGNWEGRVIENSNNDIPEEIIGKNVSVRYIHLQTGKVVVVYLACARTSVLIAGHTPIQCYPASGYKAVYDPSIFTLPDESGLSSNTFWTTTYGKGESGNSQFLRIFWGWSTISSGWKTLENPGKAFYRSPYLYKCYVLRSLVNPKEPQEGDACIELMKELIPALNQALSPDAQTN